MLNLKSHFNIINRCSLSLIALLLVSTLTTVAHAEVDFLHPSQSGPTDGTSIGSLPSTNQWLYDRPSTFLYLSYDSLLLNSRSFVFGNYTDDVGSTNFKYLSLDSFMRLFNLASPESSSIFGKFGFWGEFSLGFGLRDGSITDNDSQTTLTSETSTLTALFGKVGLQLVYDYPSWIKPYVGMSMTWYGFKNTSSMSGANAQGGGSFYGPVAGIHFPLTFIGRISLYGEVQKVLATPGDSQIFADGTNFNGGLGFIF